VTGADTGRKKRRWAWAGFLATGALGLAAAFVLAVSVGGCEGGLGCTSYSAPSVWVGVGDAAGQGVGESVAQVELEVDGAWERCEFGQIGSYTAAPPEDPLTWWSCGSERAGTLRVRMVAAGLEPQVQEVQVPEDECHVHTQTVRFTLPAGYTPPEPDPNGADAGATDTSAPDAGARS